ncbi:AmiS/UreI family transporter [Ammoniphilus sp. CFH 90114]|uniref:AmiS/UreI family transporter n=1 Tax=Ammoniphilus sp. CFH 90114 TaxID=2493665 RepID=UPI00100E3F71|nr:AmiS/UreI family transporter [Ammoniphilus sp. CFH 90114]RXT05297.1 transporter [Ammoniphilus sp. CFH 90114]
MGTVGLMYVGAVLFVNSLMLLGKVDGKSAGVFNLFIGTLQVITPFYLIFTANGDLWAIFNASGIFLFGLTYLYVGITNLKGYDGSGVGWYSLWVAILAVGYGIMSIVEFNDLKFGVIWFMWAFLWTLFFLLLALKKEISIFTGWVTLIQAWVTATIPAFLTLINKWETIGTIQVYIISLICIFVFATIFNITRKRNQNKGSSHGTVI